MSNLKRAVSNFGKTTLRQVFEIGQGIGLDILPRHFYSEIPNIQELKRESDWQRPRSLVGVHGRETENQIKFVKECFSQSLKERLVQGEIYAQACSANGEPGFGFVEANFLYCFIHEKRPARIVQIGSGVSTAVILAASREAGYKPEIICIDPFPTQFLRKAAESCEIKLIVEKAQQTSLETLTDLGKQGFLFIDSTHTVKPGSEVNYLILEVLPRLPLGSYVHFHDIYFPYDYSRGLLTQELFFHNESTLLQAFLTNNPKYTLMASLSMLHYAHPEELKQIFPSYHPAPSRFGLEIKDQEGHFPSSAYLQVVS